MTHDTSIADALARIDAEMRSEGYDRLTVAQWLTATRPAVFWHWTSIAGQDPGFVRCDGVTSGFAPRWSKHISLYRANERHTVSMAEPDDPIYVRRAPHADPGVIDRHIAEARADAEAFGPGLAQIRLRDAEILGAMARECRTTDA